MISTQPLTEALAEYDRTAPARWANWENAQTNEDVIAAEAADKAAKALVCEAFYAVTCDRNTRANCMLVDIAYARKIAALGELEPFRPNPKETT